MSELSSDDVVAIVGPIGDAAVAEIIGTGIISFGACLLIRVCTGEWP